MGELSWELHSSTPLAGVAHFRKSIKFKCGLLSMPGAAWAWCLNSRRQLRSAASANW
ncbi:hypothetical protein SBA7_1030006 [Candidatus Sulfotelmatobacter sp. SbA7]|nr:hypothetical protein SBA7_1030006 [Candidatus Sulfotelmatobacter sp. SbA7]